MNFITPTPHFSKNYTKIRQLFYSIKQTYGTLSDMNSVFCLFTYCLVATSYINSKRKKAKTDLIEHERKGMNGGEI